MIWRARHSPAPLIKCPAGTLRETAFSRRFTMARPLIGITSDYINGQPRYQLPITYAEAVARGGGLPVMLPVMEVALISDYLDLLDAVVLAGGEDLNPEAYGETYHPKAEPINPHRQKFEMALLAEIERRTMPVLGICLGSQVMNVHRGGSLYQFLPELERDGPLEHRRLDLESRRHEVKLVEGTHLGRGIGKPAIVANTSHKQAVRTLGRGLKVTAMSPDGVIEGTEDPTLPFYVGVQWHPERMTDERDHLRIFELLTEAARKNQK
jgi:putative glutamine amidotransferase